MNKDTSHGRFYQIEGRWLPSVTTILKSGFPTSYGLLQWMKNQPNAETADRIRDEAAERGSITHAHIEALLRDGRTTFPAGIDPDIPKMVEGAKKWFKANVESVIQFETILHCEKAAGRADLICVLKQNPRIKTPPQIAIVDFKSSKSIGPSYYAQIGAYARMYCQMHGKQLHELTGVIVQLKPNTKAGYLAYNVELQGAIQAFDHAYGLYKYLELPLAPQEEPEPIDEIILDDENT